MGNGIAMSGTKTRHLARAALFAATFIWGVSFVTMKNVLASVSPLYIISIRFCGSALVLLPVCANKLKHIDKAYWLGGFFMGLALLFGYVCQTFGLQLTTPGKSAFLTSAYCIIVPFLYWLFIKKKPDVYNVTAAFICIAGIGLITVDSSLRIGTGDALTVGCGFFFAVHIVITSKFVTNRDPITLVMLQFFFSGVAALICAIVFESPPTDLTSVDVWNLVFLTAICTALCIVLQVFAQKQLPPSQAAVIMTFESVFGALSSFILYKEVLTVKLTAGFALTFAAVIISETKLKFLRASRKDTL